MKLRIEKAIYGGAGLARIPVEPTGVLTSDNTPREPQSSTFAGKTVFVPMTIPGELIEAHITADHRTFANAELDLILEPAPSRTQPPCLYYGTCGGCHYQHATYTQQLETKAAILHETLDRAGILNRRIAPSIAIFQGEPWNYRNRIRLEVRPPHDGRPGVLCYRQRGSHSLLAVDQCPIAAPILVRALLSVQRLFNSRGEDDRLFQEIEFFTNDQQDSVLLSLSSTSAAADDQAMKEQLERFCTTVQAELPELRGAAIFSAISASEAADPPRKKSGSKPHRDRTRKTIATWGAQSLTYTAATFDYRVSLGSFFQVNRFLIDGLVRLVTRDRAGDLAWDLYAGAGLFARALTGKFGLVRAVESAASSCGDLRHNLAGTPHKIVESTTVDFLRLQVESRSKVKPDVVVVDPPRAGLGTEVATLIARVAPSEIVYVSCDPTSLARDLRALLQSGYQLQDITLVDLFPQTFHMESVSRLSLR